MSALPDFKSNHHAATPRQTWPLAALVVFLVCLLAGGAGVAWRAKARSHAREAEAVTRATAAMLAFEAQFREAIAGSELMAVVARQTGGNLSEFQKTASGWLAGRPGVASLELAPGGVIGAVAPRPANDVDIGRNLLADPLLATAAREAVRKRGPVAGAPVKLAGNETGLVVCAPVLQTDRSGRESLWGYATAAVRFRDALALARVDELIGQGYDYLLFMPAQGQQKSWIAASRGNGPFQAVPQRAIRISNLEIRLAVKPAGWVSGAKGVLDAGAVLIFAMLLALLVHLRKSQAESAEVVGESEERCVRAETALKQAQEENRIASQRLETTRLELARMVEARRQAESLSGELRSQLDEALRQGKETGTASETTLKQQAAKLSNLEARLEASAREARETLGKTMAELEEARRQLAQVRKRAAEGETKMAAEFRAEREAAEDLRGRLDQQQAANSDLQSRLDAALRSASQAETRVEELTALLRKPPKATERAHNGRKSESPPDTEPPVQSDEAKETPPPPTAGTDSAPCSENLAAPEPVQQSEPVAPTPPAPEPETQATAPTPAIMPKADARAPQEPPADRRPGKPPKRKKSRRDDQMDLFMPVSADDDGQRPGVVARGMDEAVEHSPALQPRTEVGETPAAVLELSEEKPGSGEAVVVDLPEIEGLDTSEGLASSGGDPKAYLRALGHFVDQHAGTARKIRDALVQSDIAEAERKLRGLKLAATEVGAASVQTAVLAVSKALQDRADSSDAEFTWGELEKVMAALVTELKQALLPPREKHGPVRKAPPPPPVDPPPLRKAVNEILPLFAGKDPGAKDCLKANRSTFRSTFSAESYLEFEQLVRGGKYDDALEQLKKAVKKHGISL